jgi:hypothetical protein
VLNPGDRDHADHQSCLVSPVEYAWDSYVQDLKHPEVRAT